MEYFMVFRDFDMVFDGAQLSPRIYVCMYIRVHNIMVCTIRYYIFLREEGELRIIIRTFIR